MGTEVISYQEAKANGLKRYFTGKPCKHGHVADRFVSTCGCTECSLGRTIKWFHANKNRISADLQVKKQTDPFIFSRRAKRFRDKYPERVKASKKAHLATPKGKAQNCAQASKRRAEEMQRTPKWADFSQIQAVYERAAVLTAETGIPHHVDHEIPLKGEKVSGLHVHINLRPLPAKENLSKHNKFTI